ncbi:MAG: hypothetical protein HY553_03570 [Elusimicrobia bacterium]|nr:hypothetical protein [Elusimicrobiota bacterium]
MRLALAVAALGFAAGPVRAEEPRSGKDAALARVTRVAAGLARGCDLFDGKAGATGGAADAVEGGWPAAPAPTAPQTGLTPSQEPLYKEVAAPVPATAPVKGSPDNPLAWVLEGTRNLAHRLKSTIGRIFDGTRNL